jgi:Zn-dependent protease with chaperone function
VTLAAAPTLLIEPTSAWVVILAVSFVTLPVVLLARRLMRGGGGAAASVLLALPLALPLLAALLYERGVFPEIAVLRPALLRDLGQDPGSLEHLLFLSNGSSDALVPYLLSGSAGGLIVLIGGAISAFMLMRRLAGRIMLARVLRRCVPLQGEDSARVEKMVAVLSATARVRRIEVLVLPGWACGAFAVGGRRARILISADLLESLTDDELEAVLAHEIAHVAAHDMQVVAFAGVLRDMTAWNPLSHVALKRLLRDRELEADRWAASMTGKPLAVASSLIKMCDLLRARPNGRPRAALAMLRRRRGVALRVNSLLALSDGGTVAVRGQTPYVLVGILVLALALQVGATVASYRGSTFAIVLGTPDADDTQIWSMSRQRDAAGATSGVARRALSPLANGIAVRRDDLWNWLTAVQKKTKRGALGGRIMASVRDGWQALPVLQGGGMAPFGIYRVEPAFQAPNPATLEELQKRNR